ncbi:Uncharacterised protein [Vibrio cholerae]|nr:Uncharacterised protein [Vibrio cholerae]
MTIGTCTTMVLLMLTCHTFTATTPLCGMHSAGISPAWIAKGPTAAERLPQFPLQSTNGLSIATCPNR